MQGEDENSPDKKNKEKKSAPPRKLKSDQGQEEEGSRATVEKVDALRKQLRDCEDKGEASLAQAKGKVVLQKKLAAEIVSEIDKCKVIDGTLFISTAGSPIKRAVVSVRRGSKAPCIHRRASTNVPHL